MGGFIMNADSYSPWMQIWILRCFEILKKFMTCNNWEKLFIYLRRQKENSSSGFHSFMPIKMFTFEQHGSWEGRGKKEKREEEKNTKIFKNLGDAPRIKSWEYACFHPDCHKSEKQGWGPIKNLAQDVMLSNTCRRHVTYRFWLYSCEDTCQCPPTPQISYFCIIERSSLISMKVMLPLGLGYGNSKCIIWVPCAFILVFLLLLEE